jgi:hypothetical protein
MFNSFGLLNNKDAQNSYENVICFKNYLVKKTLEYQNAISIYYGWQQVLHFFKMLVGQSNWAMAHAITNTLFPIVNQCVIKPNLKVLVVCQMHLFAFAFCIVMKVNVANIEALNQPLIHGDFDSKLQEFKQKMMVQVVRILMSLLTFLMIYNHSKSHNMLTIMLDLHYKNMKYIQNFMGNSIVAKYNVKIMCLFFYCRCIII